LDKPTEYRVRNFQKGDETAIAKLFSECFGPMSTSTIRRWHRIARVRAEDVFLGIADNKPASHVSIELMQLHHGENVYLKTAGIGGVCTDSDYRKKGVVTNLMNLALAHAQREGFSNASLFTGITIPAHRIYLRLGFVDVLTTRFYTKFIDYPFVFSRWIRYINRSLKDSKVAARKLEQWQKSVVIRLKEVGSLSFRLKGTRFQRLDKLPKQADVDFSTDLQTYTSIRRELVKWSDAVKARKLVVNRGEPVDIEMLNRILTWSWSD
jgi:GNAT superfamily N-acetyltransferase